MSDTVTLTRGQAQALLALAQKGQALANAVVTTVVLGQSSPAALLDYAHPAEGSEAAFVLDFIAWSSGRKSLTPGCEARLREWGAAHAPTAVDALAVDLGLFAPTERAS